MTIQYCHVLMTMVFRKKGADDRVLKVFQNDENRIFILKETQITEYHLDFLSACAFVVSVMQANGYQYVARKIENDIFIPVPMYGLANIEARKL